MIYVAMRLWALTTQILHQALDVVYCVRVYKPPGDDCQGSRKEKGHCCGYILSTAVKGTGFSVKILEDVSAALIEKTNLRSHRYRKTRQS